jgi:hypothetical protein
MNPQSRITNEFRNAQQGPIAVQQNDPHQCRHRSLGKDLHGQKFDGIPVDQRSLHMMSARNYPGSGTGSVQSAIA